MCPLNHHIITFTGGQGAQHLSGIVLSESVYCSDPHIMRLIGSAVVQSHGEGAWLHVIFVGIG